MSGQLDRKQSRAGDWDHKLSRYGLGLIVLGLVGLLLPMLGVQLHRLRALGSYQWIVLALAVSVGSALVAWSYRRKPRYAIALPAGSIVLMLLFAWLSFWRHAGTPIQEAPAGINTSAGTVPLLEVVFTGTRSKEDFLLLSELVKDCVPTATRTQSRYGQRQAPNSNQQIVESVFSIGPVPSVSDVVQQVTFGKPKLEGANRLVVEVKYPLPARAQAFEKRVLHYLSHLRSNDPRKQSHAAVILETLDPIVSRGEVVQELIQLLGTKQPPPGVVQCFKKWGTSADAPAILHLLRSENSNPSELLNVLSVLSPDDAIRESVKRLEHEPHVAESILISLGSRAEDEVSKAVGSPDAQARLTACRILAEIGTVHSLSALKDVEADEDRNIAEEAARAIEHISRRSPAPGN